MMMDESRAVLGAWNTCWGSRTNALPNELLMILMTMMMMLMMMTMIMMMLMIILLLLILCQINIRDYHGVRGKLGPGQVSQAQFA